MPDTGAKPCRRRWLLGLLTIILVIAVTAILIALRSQIRHLENYGYAGVFLISLLGSATVLMPMPGLALVFVMGSILNPALVGLAAGAGAAIGELVGYIAGYGGNAVIKPERWGRYRQIKGLVARRGSLVVFFAAVIPNPAFDIVGIAAGALRVPLWKFLLGCWTGVTVKSLVTALGGHYGLDFLLRFI